MTDMQADLELMIKSEISGRMSNVENRLVARIDRQIEELVERIGQPRP